MPQPNLCTLRLTNGADPLVNPDASLGGTLNSGGVARKGAGFVDSSASEYEFVDATFIGSPNVIPGRSWVLFQGGPHAGHASPVLDFDGATGTFRLVEGAGSPFSGGGLVTSDYFSVFEPGLVWSPVFSPPTGERVQYRAISIANLTGSVLTGVRLYAEPLSGGNARLLGAVTNDQTPTNPVTLLTDDSVEPDLATDLNEGPAIVQRELREMPPLASLVESPPSGTRNLVSGRSPLWLARVTPAGSPPRPGVVWLVRLQFTNVDAGFMPNPFHCSWLFMWDEGGYDAQVSFKPDRQLREGAGCRFEVTVEDGSGQRVSGAPVDYVQTAGDGALAPRSIEDRQTDALGRSFVSYSTDPGATEGETVTIQARVS